MRLSLSPFLSSAEHFFPQFIPFFPLQLRVSAGWGCHGEHPEDGRGGKKEAGDESAGFPACASRETHTAGAHTANPAVDGGLESQTQHPKRGFGGI